MSESTKSDPAPVNTIVPGDCIASMNSWPAGCLDLIFADPPYNIGYAYDHYEDTRDDHDYVKWTQDWVSACARLLTPTGSLFILIGDEYAAETRLHLKHLERERQLVFRNWIIWHYTFGQNCKAKFNRSHAHLLYCAGTAAFGKKGTKGVVGSGAAEGDKLTFTFNRSAIAVPSARQTTYADVRANPTGKLPDDVWYLRPQEALEDRLSGPSPAVPPAGVSDGTPARGTPGSGGLGPQTDPWYFDPDGDTWYLSRLCGTFKERVGWHPCQLPEALLERIIKVSSNPGDVVFDPFTGSGTTLAVAARLGRRWLGCELSEDYAKKATQRIAHVAATGQTLQTTQEERGVGGRGRPTKKKPEPHRSAGLF